VPKEIISDVNRIRQILLNLLGNSLKFTSKGYVELRIECELIAEIGRVIKFSVIDSGVGIKQKDIKKLFKMYGMLDNKEQIKMNPNGTGLGLKLSNDLAKLLGPDGNKGI